MAWADDDGQHEGSVGMLLPDGAVGTGWQSKTVLVSVDPAGRNLDIDDWQYRPDGDVTGWLPRCSCGWSGHPWIRATDPRDFDPVMRVAYSPDSFVPETLEDGPLHDEWRGHAFPLKQLAPLAAAYAEAGQRLDDAVATARSRGVSWTQIGTAVGITRQSAHERWSRNERP